MAGSCSQIPSCSQRGLLGRRRLWSVEQRRAGSDVTLWEQEVQSLVRRSLQSPQVSSRACPAWWGAGGLYLSAGLGGPSLIDHRMEPALARPPQARESPGILLKCRAESVGLGLRLCISDKLRSRAGTARQHTARIGSALHVCSQPGGELASPGEVFKCAGAGTHSMPNKSQSLRVEPQHRSVSVSSWQSVTLLTYYFWPCWVFAAAWAFLWFGLAGVSPCCRARASLRWPLSLQGAGSSHAGFSSCGHGRSCGSPALEHRLRSGGVWAQLL